MSFAVVVSDIAPLYTKPEPLCELADEALAPHRGRRAR